ncbi:MAG: 50S ribosome-binding GTPase [Desulfomonile tiedjei]|nr:50S ribosome-binding GTPase [Desulfomonile tiedjei]
MANRSSIAHSLDQMHDFLETDGLMLLLREHREALLGRTEELIEKTQGLGELLYVGILGGTGVGKSTLINALALKEISSPSDRRPFTDRVVAYRHRDVVHGLEKMSHLLRSPDAVHDSLVIRDLVLLDLPDFDSQEPANRRTVLEMLPALDCAIWVVSPEKYADAIFYRFVKQTVMNRENFTFVLNKADELVSEREPQPHRALKDVLGDLAFRLHHEAGMAQPRLFSLSALAEFQGAATDPVLQSEFRRFRDFLMVERDAKDIASVKTGNLREETRSLLAELNELVRPKEKTRFLHELEQSGAGEEPLIPESSLLLLEEQKRLAEAISLAFLRQDDSIGPVRWGMRVFSFGRRAGAGQGGMGLEEIFRTVTERLAGGSLAGLETAAARLDSELLLALRSAGAASLFQEPRELVSAAVKQASESLAHRMEMKANPRTNFFSRIRRSAQRLVLLLPVLLLALRLSGLHTMPEALEQPGLLAGFRLILNILTSLFGAEGLIGLAALALCEFFLIWYLSSRRMARIERVARRFATEAMDHLRHNLDAALERVEATRSETVHRVQGAMDRLKALNSALDVPQWTSLVAREDAQKNRQGTGLPM